MLFEACLDSAKKLFCISCLRISTSELRDILTSCQSAFAEANYYYKLVISCLFFDLSSYRMLLVNNFLITGVNL